MQSEGPIHAATADTRRRRLLTAVVLAAAALTLMGCFGGSNSKSTSSADATSHGAPKGGILKLGVTQDPGLDPQKDNYQLELFWCCLSRTLLSYNLRPVDDGGLKLQPDLATKLPEISSDGLTYTLKLKRGVHYGPPFQDREVTAKDIVRGLQRGADPAVAAPNASSFSAVKGWTAAGKKPGSPISGVETPDAYTIVFHLTEPSARFEYALANPLASPLPPGAAEGHDKDYNRYVVSTGPYMVAGSDKLDFSLPPSQQKPLSGYQPDRFIRLVRNPSYKSAPGDFRQANPDEIQFTIGGTVQDIAQKITAGTLDAMFVDPAPAQAVRQYSTSPNLKDRLHVNPKPLHSMMGMFNLAQPPFDDVHVRRAVNYVLDRPAIVRSLGGVAAGTPAYHLLPPAMTGDARGDDSYEKATGDERLDAARAEMRQSAYDPGHSGSCTAPACKQASVINLHGTSPMATLIKDNLAQIGIQADLPNYDVDTAFGKCADPKQHVGLCTDLTLGSSTPNPAGIAEILLSSNIQGCCDIPLFGATPKQLSGWGYQQTHLPSVDAQMAKCAATRGDAGTACWAEIDDYVTYELAAIVPVMYPKQPDIVSSRVRNYAYDMFGFMSLDTVAVGD
jgi:peptide/nickel transport system substrate-binding protein